MAPAATFFVADTDLLAWRLGPKVRSVNPYFLLGVHAVPGGLAVHISGLKHLWNRRSGRKKIWPLGGILLRKKVP